MGDILTGRICIISDVFDALTNKRIYKPAYSVEKSISIMKNEMGVGKYFDPAVFDAFTRGILNLYNLIKIPLHKYEIYCDILKSKAAFEADNEKEADIEEIAEQSGINRIKVEKIINLIPRISSIDSFVSDNTENDNLALSEVIGDDEEKTSPVSIICNNENLTLLDKWLSSLDEKERLVIILRYGLYEDGEPLTLQNIAAIFKLTPESIRQLEMKAMIKLRKMANNKI